MSAEHDRDFDAYQLLASFRQLSSSMAPDLNSLPPSNSPTIHPTSTAASTTTTATTSAVASATTAASNARANSPHGQGSPRQRSPTLHHRSSPRLSIQRRASSRLGSFSLNDSTSSSPITADPHHQRQPSLGELHQELEEEQEAQVNRLLTLIRQQQATIASYEGGTQHAGPSPLAPDDPTASRRQSQSQSQASGTPSAVSIASPTVPAAAQQQHPPTTTAAAAQSLSRASSHRSHSSLRSSPSLTAAAGTTITLPERGRRTVGNSGEYPAATIPLPEDVALVHAEAQMIARENQMLKGRIRELERQVADARRGREQQGPSAPA